MVFCPYFWTNYVQMKYILSLLAVVLLLGQAKAQISVTASDMPVSGDTLRYSTASAVGSGINLADSGTGMTWNYSSLSPRAQAVDTYKTALTVSLTYLLISINAYGYKVADSFPGGSLLPVSITQLYTFFEKQGSNTRYAAVAFGAKIAGIPTPFNYTKDDIWYRFPLTYGNSDSNSYALNITLSSTLSLKQAGYRKTRVDGWGTIVTPYYTSPVNCIRVRSEIHEIDSINFGFPIGIPRNTVEYKWLVNGDHYPALWVTANVAGGGAETIAVIRYRDIARDVALHTETVVAHDATEVKAVPNPAANGLISLAIPQSWKEYSVEVFDMQSKIVLTGRNEPIVNLQNLPSGQYIGRVICGDHVAYVQLVKP